MGRYVSILCVLSALYKMNIKWTYPRMSAMQCPQWCKICVFVANTQELIRINIPKGYDTYILYYGELFI